MATAVGIGVLLSVAGQTKARRETRKAGRLREAQEGATRRSTRQKALATAAKRRAEIRAQSTGQLGVGATSTAALQASGSITSQMSSNIGLSTQLQQLESQRTHALGSAATAQGVAGVGQAISQVGASYTPKVA